MKSDVSWDILPLHIANNSSLSRPFTLNLPANVDSRRSPFIRQNHDTLLDKSNQTSAYASFFDTPYSKAHNSLVVVFAKLINPSSQNVKLVLVEHVYDIVWSIIQLDESISMKEIRGIPAFKNQDSKSDQIQKETESSLNTTSSHLFLPQLFEKYNDSSNLVVSFFNHLKENCHLDFEALITQPANLTTPICLSEPNTVSRESTHSEQDKGSENIITNLPKPVAGPASLTLSGIDQYIKRKYYESLYITKTHIAYFVKSTLSRARTVCGIDIKQTKEKLGLLSLEQTNILNQGVNTLISTLAYLVLGLGDLDIKYNRRNFSQTLLSMESLITSDLAQNEPNELDEILGPRTNPDLLSNGAYSNLEFKYLKKWAASKFEKYPGLFRDLSNSDSFSSALNPKKPFHPNHHDDYQQDQASLHTLTENLKIREIQLQLILILEIMSLQTIQNHLISNGSISTVPASTKSINTKKKQPKRRLAIGPAARQKLKTAGSKPLVFKRPTIGLAYVDTESDEDENEYEEDQENFTKGPFSLTKILHPIGAITTVQGRRIDLDIHSDLLFDRLCIWQATSNFDFHNESHPSSKPRSGSNSNDKRTNVSVLGKTPAQIAAELDKAQDFCREVVLPFFNARLHEKCKSFVRTAKGISGRVKPQIGAHSQSLTAAKSNSKVLSMRSSSLGGAEHNNSVASFSFINDFNNMMDSESTGTCAKMSASNSSFRADESLLSTLQNDTSLVMRPGSRLASRSNTSISNITISNTLQKGKNSSPSKISLHRNASKSLLPNKTPNNNKRNSLDGFNSNNRKSLGTASESQLSSTALVAPSFRGGLSTSSKQLSESRNQFNMARRSSSKQSAKRKSLGSNFVSEAKYDGDDSISQQQLGVKQKKFGATLVNSFSHTLAKAKKKRHSMPATQFSSRSSTKEAINSSSSHMKNGEIGTHFDEDEPIQHYEDDSALSFYASQQLPAIQYSQQLHTGVSDHEALETNKADIIIDQTPKKRKRGGYEEEHYTNYGDREAFSNTNHGHSLKIGTGNNRHLNTARSNTKPRRPSSKNGSQAHASAFNDDSDDDSDHFRVVIEGTPQKHHINDNHSAQNRHLTSYSQYGLNHESMSHFPKPDGYKKQNILNNISDYEDGFEGFDIDHDIDNNHNTNKKNTPLQSSSVFVEKRLGQHSKNSSLVSRRNRYQSSQEYENKSYDGFPAPSSFERRLLKTYHQPKEQFDGNSYNNNDHENQKNVQTQYFPNYNEPAHRTKTVYGPTKTTLQLDHNQHGNETYGYQNDHIEHRHDHLGTPQKEKRRAEIEAELGFSIE